MVALTGRKTIWINAEHVLLIGKLSNHQSMSSPAQLPFVFLIILELQHNEAYEMFE